MHLSPRRSDLDGLRALAVALVVGFHAGVPALRGAFVAVDVFFVLSGYFLATTLARALATGEELDTARVIARRTWRLLPVLIVVVLGTLASTLLYAPIDRAGVARHAVPVSAFVGNIAFAAQGVNYFGSSLNPLLHTWTLGVELQLAILLPLLVLLFAKWGESRAETTIGAERRWIILRSVMVGLAGVGAVSFTLSVLINDISPMWAYFGPHTRLWSYIAGALMAFVTGGGQSALGSSAARVTVAQGAGIALLVVPSLFYDSTLEYPGVMALAPVVGTLLLLLAGDLGASTPVGRFLGSAPLVAVGRLSFAWYLWHAPLMTLGEVLSPGIGVGGKLAWGVAGLGAAWLTMRLLEQRAPSAVLTRASTDRPLLTAAGVSLALALLSAGTAWSNTRYVGESEHRRYSSARGDDMGHECWGGRPREIARVDCAFGDADSPTTIALLGDSHASHWLGGLDLAGGERGWKIDAHVMGACPAADLRGLISGAAARLYGKCAEFQLATMGRLAAVRPRAVILSNSDNYMWETVNRRGVPALPESVWIDGLRRTYRRLNEMGIEVIVMRGLPWVPFDVPSCLSRRAAGLPMASECVFTPDRALMARAQRAQDEAARGLRVRFIDMNDQLCGARPGRCTTERGGMILYTDDNHISRSFSRSMGQLLADRIARALDR